MNELADFAWRGVAQTSRLPGGERVTIRVVRPQDAEALQGYFRALSGEAAVPPLSRCARRADAEAACAARRDGRAR